MLVALKGYITLINFAITSFMSPLHKYLINATDQFNPDYFSSINEEITAINVKIEQLPLPFKPEIIVSFLKDHSLRNVWINANPELTTLVTSGSLFNGDIEALFASCTNNPGYRQDFESYLMKRFGELES